jgi:predicted permease
MGFVKAVRARLKAVLRSRAADADLREEIAFHIELETEKNLRLGMTRDEARRVAVVHFGGVERVREEHRDVRRLQWIDDAFADARFALRSMRRTPALTGAAIVTLALGIGANVAIFSAVNAVVLQPLPFPNSDRLMTIAEENPEKRWHLQFASPANFLDWRAGVSDFSDAMAYTSGLGRSTMTGRGDPVLLTTSYVSGTFFRTLGVRPIIGRDFTENETWQNGASIAVLSARTWREHFGADSTIIGKSVTIDDKPTQIIGVVGDGFAFPQRNVEIWMPIGWSPTERAQDSFRRAHWIRVVARLKPDASREHADAQLQSVVQRLKRDYPATNKYMGATMLPLHDFLVGDTRLPLLVLLTSVALLLVIACANVGNLLLVQATGRQREASLRLALGAGRSRLVRQALAESLVLSIAGGMCGLALGWAGTRALVRLQPPRMLHVEQFGVDLSVLLYVVAITMVSALIFGAAPAIWMRHRDPAESLKDGGRTAARGTRAKRWANALVVGEVSLALMMTVGAGLLVRSLWAIRHVDPGFDARGVLDVEIGLGQQYSTPERIAAFTNQLLERARAIPGVKNAALATGVPLTNSAYTTDYIAAGRPADGYGTEVSHRTVSADYFATMKVGVRRGRVFSVEDRRDGPPVVLITETLARSYFAGQDPIGQRIAFDKIPTPKTIWYTIIGVVANENLDALDVTPTVAVLHPWAQSPSNYINLLLRTAGQPTDLVGPTRSVVHDIDPSLALYSVKTMEQVRDESMARARFLTTLLLMFAGIGLALSVVGVYGVLAQITRNRTREMGIRIALGARATQVRWLVVRHGLGLTLAGLVVGGVGAVLSTRAMSKLLFGVAPNDPATLVGVGLLLALTSIAAAWLPAVRASRADPAVTLRSD